MALPSHIGFSEGEYGMFCHLNKHEAELLYEEIFMQEQYIQNGIQISDGDVILDIGANIGYKMPPVILVIFNFFSSSPKLIFRHALFFFSYYIIFILFLICNFSLCIFYYFMTTT